ncbi:LADA_0E10616g1_1 [Lachancea dasiensis]|uniref:LADA_0E10616g1_1 n=1 Tax=Lachancea dasiensis TaxID=1072105 RepID=A0A1G4JED0_9SACH|nr:LADA_0E10616g1_1 [Lachancea dasiensis]
MGNADNTPESLKNIMSSLFGTECSEWPFSDSALTQALMFKTQQEKTKQQFYKLECVNRSIELLKTAMSANVPGHMITHLFQGSGSGVDPTNDKASGLQDSAAPNTNSSGSSAAVTSLGSKKPSESIPLNYKFPPVNTSVTLHRRTNSPARIGAAAVANLTENNQLKEEENNELPDPGAPHPPNVAHQRSPLQFRTHRRNLSLPLARPAPLLPQELPAQYSNRRSQNPMTSVINFGSWQSYEPSPSSMMMKRQGSIKKHRKTKSATTASNFGVIDLNMANQVRLPELPKSQDFLKRNTDHTNEDENEFDDQQTCSDHSSRETTPIIQVTKGPNFANNLLNS